MSGNSPFKHILNTDLDPSDAQARRAMNLWFHEVRRTRTPVIGESAQHYIDTELPRDRRAQTRSPVLAHQKSKTQQLSSDILQRIFLYCLPEETTCVPKTINSPLVLCQINKRWRNIALSLPRLWSSLSVEMTVTGCTPRLSLIEVWLSRSGTRALRLSLLHPYVSRFTSVSVEDQPSDPRDPREDTNAVLGVFLQHFSRWEEVLLELHGYTYPALQEASYGVTSLLNTFTLLTSIGLCMNTTMALSRMFQVTPRLRNVSWTQYRDQLVPTFPWAVLTHLEIIASLSISDCLAILREGINLVNCAFLKIVLPSQAPAYYPFRAPEIRSLDLSSRLDIGPLLDYLTLPRLESIRVGSLHTDSGPRHWPHAKFLSLLSRSRCSLQWLTLTDIPINENELLQCLRQVEASLFGLSIDNRKHSSSISTAFLYRLTVAKPSGPWLCPHLRSITLKGCISATDGITADMVESRRFVDDPMGKHSEILEFVEISLPRGHETDVRRLEAMRDEGLDVRVDVDDGNA